MMMAYSRHRLFGVACVAIALVAMLAGCGGGGHGHDHEHHDEDAHEAAPASDRIDVPPNVRQNLGITFVTVERRPVGATLRLPGHFAFRPGARREYRAMLPGRVALQVEPLDRVEAGQVLFRIDSPRWQELRHEAVEAEGQIALAEANLAVAQATRQEHEAALTFLEARQTRLSDANVRQVEVETQLAQLRSQLPRLAAEVTARQVELDEAREHYASIMKVAASVTGLSVAKLMEAVERHEDEHGHDRVRWRNLEHMEVRATRAGVVQTLAMNDGGWVETGELVVEVVDPTALRFEAEAMQSDIGRLADGQRVRIVPPQGGSVDLQDAMPGMLALGVEGHAAERTLPVYGVVDELVAWARPGVGAFMDVYVEGGEQPELAIPVSSLVRDGLKTIFYRRDPKNPDQVYPVEADLGASDGRWVVVYSGVTDGDEVVLDGAYALTLNSGRRQAPPGYHYHADGTLHKAH